MRTIKILQTLMVMLLCCISVNAETFWADGVKYSVISQTDKTVEVVQTGTSWKDNSYSGSIVIPEKVTYNETPYSVINIDNAAFRSCEDLTSIVIPNSGTKIEDNAFYDCVSLSTVTMGTGVESIEGSAFERCDNLKEVHISDLSSWCNITFTNAYANPLCYAKHLFLNGEEIKDLVIPDDINIVKFATFYNCESLTSVVIHNRIMSIEKSAFCGCSNLSSLSFSC